MEERTDRKGIRNKPQRIAERVLLLREYLCANANRTHAVRIEDMKQYLNDKGNVGSSLCKNSFLTETRNTGQNASCGRRNIVVLCVIMKYRR